MTIVRDTLRLATGLAAFLREPLTMPAAIDVIRRRMATREGAFLAMLERAVFANPTSPYRALLAEAGCERGDVARLVEVDGLEEALRRLLGAGVYVTFDEFKGRTAAVRGSRRFEFRDADFDNRSIAPHYHGSTGGTGGPPARTRISLEHLAQSAPHWAVWAAAHDWLQRPFVFWTPFYAAVANRQLMCAKFGTRFVRWFCPAGLGSRRDRLRSTALHAVIRAIAGFPRPEFVPAGQEWRVGQGLAAMIAEGLRPCVVTSPSAAVRLALAAGERGASLGGVTFLLGAEPLTAARKETIEASGATAVPTYGFAEGGNVGSQCPHPAAVDDVHVSLDAWGIVQRRRTAPDMPTVDALLLTALRPACPKIMLNTEIGDDAVLETRRCRCLFDDLGYVQHLHTIRSFEKLTGDGVTFVGAEIFPVLEVALPRRFGGAVGDYQLVESQDASGLPRCDLIVSPSVGPLDESAVAAALLAELARLGRPYRLMAAQWARAGVVAVRRRRPATTARGKALPFVPLDRR